MNNKRIVAKKSSVSRRLPSIFNATREAFLIPIGDDLYTYNIATHTATRVTDSAGPKSEATFSPDGRSVAFIKSNDIFVSRLGVAGERALARIAGQLLHGCWLGRSTHSRHG